VKSKDFLFCVQLAGGTPVFQELEQLLVEKGMGNRAIMIPPQPPWRFASLMKASLCVIYPGGGGEHRVERFNLPFLAEALSCGTCVLLDRSLHTKSGYSHLAEGEHLFLFETAVEMRTHLESLMQHPEKARAVGRRAQETMGAGGDFRELLVKELSEYQEMVDGSITA